MAGHNSRNVEEVGPKPLPLDSLMTRVQATLPDPKRTWQVSLSAPRRASVYVDPYTGQVTGRNERLPFFDTMFHLHRWLLGPLPRPPVPHRLR